MINKPIAVKGWEVKTKILAALQDDVAMAVSEINEIVCMETAGLRKYLKSITLDGFAIETRLVNPRRLDSKVNMYRAKNRDQWEEFVLNESGHDLRPPELRKPRIKRVIPHGDTPFWGLAANGCLEATQ